MEIIAFENRNDEFTILGSDIAFIVSKIIDLLLEGCIVIGIVDFDFPDQGHQIDFIMDA